ncbi:hypothetical protein TNCV_1473471 [Trichonephila clavipes]|nr:hypothetical protein TNCV_1473471 [Trichonephila clavipes]
MAIVLVQFLLPFCISASLVFMKLFHTPLRIMAAQMTTIMQGLFPSMFL